MATLHMAGDDFVTDGERRLAGVLQQLPPDWVIIANKMLPVPGAASREIDFIVLGDQLVFVLDEKGYGGRIVGTDQQWTLSDGSSQRSPLNKLEYSAKLVAGRLRKAIPSFADQNAELVVSGVVLSRTEQRPSLRDPRAGRSVMLLDEVVDRLTEWDAAGPVQLYKSAQAPDAPADYIRHQRRQVSQTLYDLSTRPKIPRQVNDYEIISHWEGPAGARIFLANHAFGGERILSMYQVGVDAGKRQFVAHEVATLRKLQSTGLVPELLDPFTWSEDFFVVPSVPPEGIAIGALPAPGSLAEASQQVRMAAESLRALGRLHDAGVLHRALNPDRVFIRNGGDGGRPEIVFTQFFAARNTDQTIAPVLGEMGLDDPYAAPEIIALGADGYALANESSDTYSLALVWLEQLSGQRLETIRPRASEQAGVRLDERLDVRIPESDQGWQYLPEQTVRGLRDFFARVLTAGGLAKAGVTASRRLTADECAAELDRLIEGTTQTRANTVAAVGPGTMLDGPEGRYQVIRLLGSGATAFTYLVHDMFEGGRYAVKQFLRPAAMGDSRQAAQEFSVLKTLSHRSIPRVYDVYPPAHPFHVKMEFIEGHEAGDVEVLGRFRDNLDAWRALAGDLLSAVRYLEQHQLRHRDIKPENVIVRDGDGTAVLVDFGIATVMGAASGPAGTPGYLPPEAYTSPTPPDSIDRYATAVLLFEALFGRKPFVSDSVFVQQPVMVEDLGPLPAVDTAVARALLRAVAIDPAERPRTAANLEEAIQIALTIADPPIVIEPPIDRDPIDPDLVVVGIEKINPAVPEILSLFRNSAGGNADNRGLDTAFARSTYVTTRLDDQILPAIFRDRPRAVFLSGNPGDGKTAFLEQVRTELVRLGGTEVSGDRSGWEWTLDGHIYRSCYDASESHAGMTADEQLRHRLRGLEGDAEPGAGVTVLVAINDGRFVSMLETARDDFGWVTRAAGAAQNGGEQAAGGVWFIDLKRRSYVGLSSDPAAPSLARRALGRLVDPSLWAACEGCVAFAACPIRRNAAALRTEPVATGQIERGPAARLEHLLRISHLRGVRHLTIRDIRSGFAYLITGGRTCSDVHAARRGAGTMPAEYWRTTFTTTDDTDVMLGQFAALDPARSPQPFLERYLYFHREPSDLAARQALFVDGIDLPLASIDGSGRVREEPDDTSDLQPVSAETEDAIRWVSAVKQRLFFHGRLPTDTALVEDGQRIPAVPWVKLLPYRDYAGQFIGGLQSPEDAVDWLPRLLRGIGRSEGLRGDVFAGGLCLRVAHSEENRLTIVKVFPAEQFALEPDPGQTTGPLEAIPTYLWLVHGTSGARLRVTLDLFETLCRLADGQEPDAEELKPLLEDLVAFKSRISHEESNDFYLLEDNRRQHLLTQRDGRIMLQTNIQTASTSAPAARQGR